MRGSMAIASIRGISIRVHLSAILAFALLLFLLASAYFPQLLPGERQTTYWSVAFISVLFLYLSTLAHELGQCLVARRRGVGADSITFVMFGCTTDIQRAGARALDEVLMGLAGPSVSLALAALTALARFTLPTQSQPLLLFLEAVLLLNLWLGLFNLLPTLPLDGGRVLRGLVWLRTGDFQVATRIASLVGRVLAAAVFGLGVILIIASFDSGRGAPTWFSGFDPRLAGGAMVLMAWFLNGAARNAYRQVELQGRFQDVTVSQLMTTEPSTVAAWTSLEEVVDQYFLQRGERAVAITSEGNVLLGLLAYADVRRVPRPEWASQAAGQIMTPRADLVTVAPDDNIEVAIRRMAERHYNQLPVVEDGRLVGMIARVNILQFVEPRPAGRRRRS